MHSSGHPKASPSIVSALPRTQLSSIGNAITNETKLMLMCVIQFLEWNTITHAINSIDILANYVSASPSNSIHSLNSFIQLSRPFPFVRSFSHARYSDCRRQFNKNYNNRHSCLHLSIPEGKCGCFYFSDAAPRTQTINHRDPIRFGFDEAVAVGGEVVPF